MEDDDECLSSESFISSVADSIAVELQELKVDELTNLKALKDAVRQKNI